MMVTDPIADMLTRIRNAQTAKHDTVAIPGSKVKKALAKILLEEGYVQTVEFVDEGINGIIRITLKYGAKRDACITGIRRISKPGLRVYVNCEKLPKVLGGLGIAIISTSRGIMTDRNARTIKSGGEVLAYVW